MRLLFVVQGLFEKSDSIGFDCVYEYKVAREFLDLTSDTALFAERWDETHHPGIEINHVSQLYEDDFDRRDILIYHYCDGWPDFELFLRTFPGKVIIRWHNNTPPWFFLPYSLESVRRTLTGVSSLKALGNLRKYYFMCNSRFTKSQVRVLGVNSGHLPVVYPASRYLETIRPASGSLRSGFSGGQTRLLFVGRVVPHKGHRHVIMVAAALQELEGRSVEVCFPGRADDTAAAYVKELEHLAEKNRVTLSLPGEVDHDALEALYDGATAFVCLSEHEGFGLPVYEAMSREIPTLVWKNTAFSEVLGDHPLGFSVIDYRKIAHLLHGLRDAVTWQSVIDYQNSNILTEYTNNIVRAQIRRAIEFVASIGHEVNTVPLDNSEPIPMEISDNFITNYDLRSYSYLIEKISVQGLIGRWETQFIAPHFFHTVAGRIATDICSIELDCDDTYLLFGPYMELFEGSYRVIFDLTLASEFHAGNDRLGGIEIDVHAGAVLARRNVPWAQIGEASRCSLDILIGHRVKDVEFRIRRYGGSQTEIPKVAFSGVRLVRLESDKRSREQRAAELDPVFNALDGKYAGLEAMHSEGMISLVSADEVYSFEDEADFLCACYERILGRVIDDSGFLHYSSMLRSGEMGRDDIVRILLSSDEGKARRSMLT